MRQLLRFIKLEQFKEYATSEKTRQPDKKKPIYTELQLPVGMQVIVVESNRKGHSIITTGNAAEYFEVKGYPATVKRQLEDAVREAILKDAQELAELEPKRMASLLKGQANANKASGKK
jgi:hypothetical protein